MNTLRSSHATSVALQSPLQIQWMAVSFALLGVIIGFFLHAFTLPSLAASPAPSPIAQGNIIRPPDPSALAQGGGCGGGSTQGGGCGGAQGSGCGGSGCGGSGPGGGGCGSVQPSRI